MYVLCVCIKYQLESLSYVVEALKLVNGLPNELVPLEC